MNGISRAITADIFKQYFCMFVTYCNFRLDQTSRIRSGRSTRGSLPTWILTETALLVSIVRTTIDRIRAYCLESIWLRPHSAFAVWSRVFLSATDFFNVCWSASNFISTSSTRMKIVYFYRLCCIFRIVTAATHFDIYFCDCFEIQKGKNLSKTTLENSIKKENHE